MTEISNFLCEVAGWPAVQAFILGIVLLIAGGIIGSRADKAITEEQNRSKLPGSNLEPQSNFNKQGKE